MVCPHCCACEINAQVLLSVSLLVSTQTEWFLGSSTLQDLPTQMEYASIPAFCMQKSSCQVVLPSSSLDTEFEMPTLSFHLLLDFPVVKSHCQKW